ncbi:CAAX amino terminal protease family protein [Escherichia coli]|uniref:CAAX amino terminal protease family protein n=1 Tax=Escherichia coli TaxID=562 RepID=A0A4C4J5N1_ECOLX|nr:CPBP family glutamic-type intramembrane protease [Escherichia coli]GCS42673.1 CAAX amino terminal protease family protein [Escherichia coli]GDH57237.1 CAAX amino terminal protease family protein [Escherichia coli]GDL73469.1 CAAX amino terminal protease family protein [Escherichia coli]GDO55737.1 CAAX amino terminal protease family protein [Escherichia coli]
MVTGKDLTDSPFNVGKFPNSKRPLQYCWCWTMWLGALITSLLFVAAHRQYQNLLTLAELFLVGLITSAARIRSGGLLLVLLHMEATTLVLLFG